MTEPFRISSGSVAEKDAIVVIIERDGQMAFGEASPMAGAFYSSITPETTWEFLAEAAVPELLRAEHWWPEWAAETMKKLHPDQPFGWAGVEGALWDLRALETGKSFNELFDIEPRPVESGLAVGIYDTIAELVDACGRYMVDGYRRIKVKIEPGWDMGPLGAVREAFDVPLMVDANQAYRFDPETPGAVEALDALGLMMIEQPLPELDIEGCVGLQRKLRTPLCIDESAGSVEAAERFIARGACRIVNIKTQRLGGLTNARRLHELCKARGVPAWMGTMPELGIGSLHAIYLAMGAGCRFPTDVEASARWYVDDIIEPAITVKDGYIELAEEHRSRPCVSMDKVDKYAVRAKKFNF